MLSARLPSASFRFAAWTLSLGLGAGCGGSPTPTPPVDAGPGFDAPLTDATPDVALDAIDDVVVRDAEPEPMTMRFERVVAGSEFACGVKADGSVRCWGETAPGAAPTFSGPVENLCAFDERLCALTQTGAIECLNYPAGALPPPTEIGFVALECMDANMCARTATGERTCWGTANAPELETAIDFVSYDGSTKHACGLYPDGSFECFGSRAFGLADPRPDPFQALHSGNDFNCGLTEAGAIDCWGLDGSGSLDAPEDTGFVALDVSFLSGCALRDDRTPTCWGASLYWDTAPVLPLSQLSVGKGFACGLTEGEGHGVCWGIFRNGQTDVPLEGE